MKKTLQKAAVFVLFITAASFVYANGQNQAPPDDIYEIVMVIPTLGMTPPGIKAIEDAVNAQVTPALGAKVTLYPISVWELSAQQTLMVANNDKIDLIMALGAGIGSYVNNGVLLELDSLYERYGADIRRAEGVAMAGGYYNGKLYAIPSEEKHGRRSGFFARKDIVDELGFNFDPDGVYTVDDLEKLFAAYKAKYGSGYYCVAGTRSNSDGYANLYAVDNLGATAASGMLTGAGLDGDTAVRNLYETPQYRNYAERMYRWAQAGYYSPDAATNTEADTVQVQGGYYLGTFNSTETDMTMNLSRDCGREMIPINLIDPWAQTSMYTISVWGIPATCRNPEKTFQFLNMLYADNDLDNILTNGLEGVTYEVVTRGTRKGQDVIRYADGVNAANAPYIMPLHVFGDKLTISVFEPMTTEYFRMAEAFNAGLPANRRSLSLGYVFNATPVAAQEAAVRAVIEQYAGMITCGAQRPDSILPEFQRALRDAGIAQVIAENQRQLNAWLAAR